MCIDVHTNLFTHMHIDMYLDLFVDVQACTDVL